MAVRLIDAAGVVPVVACVLSLNPSAHHPLNFPPLLNGRDVEEIRFQAVMSDGYDPGRPQLGSEL